MFSTTNIFKGCLPLKGQHTSSPPLSNPTKPSHFSSHFRSGWSSNPTLNPHTLLTLDTYTPSPWCHFTKIFLVLTSYHRNLPCYDVISQKLALIWRHITETCLVMTSYHRNLPLLPQVPVTCIAKEELLWCGMIPLNISFTLHYNCLMILNHSRYFRFLFCNIPWNWSNSWGYLFLVVKEVTLSR